MSIWISSLFIFSKWANELPPTVIIYLFVLQLVDRVESLLSIVYAVAMLLGRVFCSRSASYVQDEVIFIQGRFLVLLVFKN